MNLESVLQGALQPNTQIVQKAYEQIKVILQEPNCVLPLFSCINSQNAGVKKNKKRNYQSFSQLILTIKKKIPNFKIKGKTIGSSYFKKNPW